MKRFALATAAVVLVLLWAGGSARADDPLGTIQVWDGGTANNYNTTCIDAGKQVDGGTISDGGSTDFLYSGCGFTIPPGAWLSVQCRQDCHVNSDVDGCDAGLCHRLFAEQWLTMPVKRQQRTRTFTRFNGFILSDGGLASATANYIGGLFAVSPADAGARCTCQISQQMEVRP